MRCVQQCEQTDDICTIFAEESKKDTSPLPNETEAQDNPPTSEAPKEKTASQNGPFVNVTADILMPTVMPSKSGPNDSVLPMANSTSFNLADFENEQDPFENLELKTLDDMAELNKVLQGAQSNNAGSKQNHVSEKEEVEPSPEAIQHAAASGQATSQQSSQQDKSMQRPVNIKDVEYPDFDTLETPDVSLSDQSYSISSQRVRVPDSYTSENQRQVHIQPGTYSAVSFSNRKPEDPGPDSQRSCSPRSYNPLPPIDTSSSLGISAQATTQNTGNRYAISSSHGHSYNHDNLVTNPKQSQSLTGSQQQSSVINGLTQYTAFGGGNPWTSSSATTTTSPWSTQAANKTSGSPAWQPLKSYTTPSPWNPPRTSAGYGNATWSDPAPTQSTNPWGPPSLYANSSWSSSSLRSAKSNPDLTKLTERPVRVLPTSHTPPPQTRTKTPPPRPSSAQVRCSPNRFPISNMSQDRSLFLQNKAFF